MKKLIESMKGQDPVSRRRFASYLARTCLGVGVAPYFASSPIGMAAEVSTSTDKLPHVGSGAAKHVIYCYMSGGMTHLDTFDPKPENRQVAGPLKAIKTKVAGMRLSEHMPNLAKVADEIAVVNSLHSTQGAHEQANYLMHTSYTTRGTIRHPALGAWTTMIKGKINETLPANIIIGGGSRAASAGFLESKYGPLPVASPRSGLQNGRLRFHEREFNRRLVVADTFDRPFRSRFKQKQVRAYTNLYAEAIKLMKSEDLDAFDIRKEPPAMLEKYGDNNFGQGLLLARRLVESGVRFIEVNNGGWDTHDNNFDRVAEKVPQVDQAMAALISDLKAKGLLKSTLVVIATEFGRTPRINGRSGRDHHPAAFSGMLAGGPIKGGQVYGKSDERGFRVAENGVSVPDFNATIAHAAGLPIRKVYHSPSGRPFQVAHKGNPITALF